MPQIAPWFPESKFGVFIHRLHDAVLWGHPEREAGLPSGLFNGALTRRGTVLCLIAYDQPHDELVVTGIHRQPDRTGDTPALRRPARVATFGRLPKREVGRLDLHQTA